MDRLRRHKPASPGVVSATRGNHGQSIALAAARVGIPATIVAVPLGSSARRTPCAPSALELGRGQATVSTPRATLPMRLAAERGLDMVPSFHRDLVCGVATYAHELFGAISAIEHGLRADRSRLGHLRHHRRARCAQPQNQGGGRGLDRGGGLCLSFAAGKVVPTNSADTMADGMAVRGPNEEALAVIPKGPTASCR